MKASRHISIWLTSTILSCGVACAELSTHITAFLLPTLRDHFAVSDHMIALSLSMSLIGVGFAGLIYGLASDVFGRRKIYLLSMLLYTLGSGLVLCSDTFGYFLAARFIQGRFGFSLGC